MPDPLWYATAREIAPYQRDGVACLRGALVESRASEIYIQVYFSLETSKLWLADSAPIR